MYHTTQLGTIIFLNLSSIVNKNLKHDICFFIWGHDSCNVVILRQIMRAYQSMIGILGTVCYILYKYIGLAIMIS